ncbi:transmembrane protein 156 isoform X2 [Amia ocellicauda]|uniref:transmembrane protein 156 isoform X2 n=1 Tax=Amia ocellicauda TaxID=2972642 RepID=UPI00346457ED
MAKAALSKLLILILVILILCLPEFFNTREGIKIFFSCIKMCLSPDEMQFSAFFNIPRHDLKDAILEVCMGYLNSSSEGQALEIEGVGTQGDPRSAWFVCETETDLQSIYQNISFSGSNVNASSAASEPRFAPQNIKLMTHVNISLGGGSEEGGNAFHCFIQNPSRNTLKTALSNHSYCIVRTEEKILKKMNKTVQLTSRPEDWSCSLRVLWLTLILTVILLVIIITVLHAAWRNQSCRKRTVALYSTDTYQCPEDLLPLTARPEESQAFKPSNSQTVRRERHLPSVPEHEQEREIAEYEASTTETGLTRMQRRSLPSLLEHESESLFHNSVLDSCSQDSMELYQNEEETNPPEYTNDRQQQ